jgi:hypothetical protein
MTRRLRARLDDLRSRQADRLESDVLGGLGGPDLGELWPRLPLSRRRAIIGVAIGTHYHRACLSPRQPRL